MKVKEVKPCMIFETVNEFGQFTRRLYALTPLQDRAGSARCFDRNQSVVYLDPETECERRGDTRYNIPDDYRTDGYLAARGKK